MTFPFVTVISFVLSLAFSWHNLAGISNEIEKTFGVSVNRSARYHAHWFFSIAAWEPPFRIDPEYYPKTLDQIYIELFDSSYEKATAEQKEALEKARDNYPLESYHNLVREVKIIMGELSEDTPRISLTDAKRIVKECLSMNESHFLMLDTRKLLTKFDVIAGAPDSIASGNGYYYEYFIDDDMTEYISIHTELQMVRLFKADDDDYSLWLHPDFGPGYSPDPSISPTASASNPDYSALEGAEISPTPTPPVK